MITIMTPTYNRAYILPQLYDSLCKQASYSFEWIIVDDGSTDGTEALVSKWLTEEKSFNIIYIKKQNGGKHRAINHAAKIARYDWFFIVDSDDYITHDAVMLIDEWIKTVEHDDAFAGVSGHKGHINTDKIIGEFYLDSEYVDATNIEREKYNLSYDKAEIYRTDIIKKFPFPEYEGENFITEAVVWDSIALAGYKLRWFNKIIYKCEYLDDGLTQAGDNVFFNNFEGYTHYIKMQIEIKGLTKVRDSVLHYYRHATKSKRFNNRKVAKKLGVSASALRVIIIKTRAINILRKNKTLFKTAKHVYSCLMKQYEFTLLPLLRRLNLLPNSIFKEMKKFRNIHKGERCFIVCTGPSLAIEDVEKLKHEITFSMNMIVKLYINTDWRPTYYCITDEKGYKECENYIIKAKPPIFFTKPWIAQNFKLPVNPILFFHPHAEYCNKTQEYMLKFSDNAYSAVHSGHTVAYAILQIAIYMGFKEIYLLGCDADYSGKRTHADGLDIELEENKALLTHDILFNQGDRNCTAFNKAKKYADKNGIKIYNATRGGKLEVFERVNLDEVLKC